MKKLYLVRHAKSSRQYTELPDFERPLNSRGRVDAPVIGELLKSMNISPDLIISSPATRAIATGRILADHMNYPLNNIQVVEEIYEAWLEDLIKVLKEINQNCISVMLIGHNPGLQLIAEYLTEFPYNNIPTCGVVGLELLLDNWTDLHKNCGKILFFERPKKGKDTTNNVI